MLHHRQRRRRRQTIARKRSNEGTSCIRQQTTTIDDNLSHIHASSRWCAYSRVQNTRRERERENESREHAAHSANGDGEPSGLTSPKSIYHVPVIDKHNCLFRLLSCTTKANRRSCVRARAHTQTNKRSQWRQTYIWLDWLRQYGYSVWHACRWPKINNEQLKSVNKRFVWEELLEYRSRTHRSVSFENSSTRAIVSVERTNIIDSDSSNSIFKSIASKISRIKGCSDLSFVSMFVCSTVNRHALSSSSLCSGFSSRLSIDSDGDSVRW